MLTLNISEADIATAKYERINHSIKAIRKRMEVIYQVSQNPNRQRAAELAGVHRNSVKNYIKQYNKGGLEALRSFEYKGFVSILGGHRVTLEAYFKEHPVRTAKEAAFRIEAITKERLGIDEVRRFMHKIGMKPRKTGHVPAKADPQRQAQFLDETLMPLIKMAQGGDCDLFFMDAAHFILLPFVGILWSFARVFIKAAAGRNRINVLGALHFTSRKLETVVNTDYVNADTIAELLCNLAEKYRRLPIYVVLDNARYQHCDFIKQLAISLNITLVFLPPYSPNLNLIERVWRYIKKDVLSTRYFDCPKKFHLAIRQALSDINSDPQTKQDLTTLITPKFQTFAQNLLP
jgi:transposase